MDEKQLANEVIFTDNHESTKQCKFNIEGISTYYYYFCTKTYVVASAHLMSTHSICFRAEIRKKSVLFGCKRAFSGAMLFIFRDETRK